MGFIENNFEQFCHYCKKVTDHHSFNDNDDTGTHVECCECERLDWTEEKQQNYEFRIAICEIAFGEDARLEGDNDVSENRKRPSFTEEELIEKLQEYSRDAFAWEEIRNNNPNIDSEYNIFHVYSQYQQLKDPDKKTCTH